MDLQLSRGVGLLPLQHKVTGKAWMNSQIIMRFLTTWDRKLRHDGYIARIESKFLFNPSPIQFWRGTKIVFKTEIVVMLSYIIGD